MDWYDAMAELEKSHGEKYLINCKGGLIEISKLPTYEVVGLFTANQAECFFNGLLNYEYDKFKVSWDDMENFISYAERILSKTNAVYLVKNDYMDLLEKYCYIKLFIERI